MNNMKKSVAVTVGALLAGGMSVQAASANPFSYSDLGSGYQQEQSKEREAKCGEDKKAEMKEKAKEAKCGEGKCGEEMKAKMKEKAKEGKCGEGKCGEDMKAKMSEHQHEKKAEKAEEGKCGEGKCGEGKCGGQ